MKNIKNLALKISITSLLRCAFIVPKQINLSFCYNTVLPFDGYKLYANFHTK